MKARAEENEILKRALAMLHSKPEPAPNLPCEGQTVEALEVEERETIQAVKIASSVLGDDIWLILDRSFVPSDGLACYYPEEIPLLRDKTPEELREIHKAKLAFPGCRVIQEGAEAKTSHEFEPNNPPVLLAEALASILKPIVEEAVREAINGHREIELLTPEQLAERIKVPISWVYEQSRQGNIPTHRIGRYIRFDVAEVLESQKKKD